MTSKLTRERIEWLNYAATGLAANGTEMAMSPQDVIALTECCLAAMDSEPVAWLAIYHGEVYDEAIGITRSVVEAQADHFGWESALTEIIPLYRHAQTVVPATLPCSVELKPGLIIGKGCKTETLLTALRHRADYNADIDAMTPEERAKHDASIEAFKAMLPQPAPVVPEDNDELARLAEKFGAEVAWANEPNEFHHLIEFTPPQFRAAMLQAGNSPAIPEGYVMVPMRLTAENGAKGVLSGEFSETQFVNCPECFGDDECETCDGSGRIEITVPVTWTTIKEIWAKGVEHFAAAPQDVPDGK
ncbi:TPA: hypothetical protein ACS1E9_004289 [Klebsiella oxytoca]